MLLAALFLAAAAAATSGRPHAGGAHAEPAARRWSDPATWPAGVVPRAGQDVTIPAGARVLLDVSPPALGTLTVAGTLAFAPTDLALTAHVIRVAGRLEVGSAAAPFRRRATITLTGAPSDRDAETGKGIWVLPGGALELHGLPRTAWRRLARTAAAGDGSIGLDGGALDWVAGDSVVVAPSGYWQEEAEVRVVAGVAGATLTLDRPLRYQHWGRVLTIAGRPLDQRAEVGLLSRNVVVRGDAASEAEGYGGHILVLAGATAHLDGVELYRMGQRARPARYPMHWHLAGSVAGQSVTRTSVHRTYNKCVTIHGTHDALLADNVCYDHEGHGYFIEDGDEHGNVLRGNLGVFSRAGRAMPTDRMPATFWVTNPDNALVGNAAAGSAALGIWYALPKHPTGAAATTTIFPFMTPLGEFDGNVAHSNGGDGVRVEGDYSQVTAAGVEVDYRPREGGVPWGRPVMATFRNLTTYMNAEQGFWSRGDHHAVVGLAAAGNRVGVKIGDASIGSESLIRDALLVGGTELRSRRPSSAPYFGTHLYDGPVRLEDVTFANYPASGGQAGGGAIGPEWNFDGIMAPGYAGRGLRFVNSNRFVYRPAPRTDGERQAVYRDEDGSVTGRAGWTVVPENPLLVTPDCRRLEGTHAHACPGGVASLWLQGWEREAGRFVAPATVTRDDGATARLDGYQPHNLAMTLPVGRTYTIAPEHELPRARLDLSWYELGAGRTLNVRIPWTRPGMRLLVDPRRAEPMGASCAAAFASPRTTAAYEPASGVLCVRIVGVAGASSGALSIRAPE